LKAAQENQTDSQTAIPNARFLILDPNGEYRNSFVDIPGGARVFQLPPPEKDAKSLVVPGWIWNTNEWCAFASAAPLIQRPLLQQSIRTLRAGGAIASPIEQALRRRMLFVTSNLDEVLASGGDLYGKWGPAQNFAGLLKAVVEDSNRYIEQTDGVVKRCLFELASYAQRLRDEHRYPSQKGDAYNTFSETEVTQVYDLATAVLKHLPLSAEPVNVADDAPIPFDVAALPDYLEQAASQTQAATMMAGLVVRIQNMLADSRLSSVIAPEDELSFSGWIEDHIGADAASNGAIAIIDLSLVPTEIIHIVVAVIGRVVFEALQRYVRAYGVELPTVVVLEEAHTFVARGREDDSVSPTASDTCRTTFEKIAREGRKFGLGLVISSQRPSEISPTVLSQCNTFLLHRLVNDRDQDLVGRLVPDALGGMLRELPTLPARHAIIVGQATPLPLLLEVNELPWEHQPRSPSPRFWDVWTGLKHRPIDWEEIVREWGG
jgi:hypothetical protein